MPLGRHGRHVRHIMGLYEQGFWGLYGRHSEIEKGWAAEGILQTPAPFSQIINH